MTERISLVEAYDNRDVIAQLVRLRDNVDELLNILKDIDPNGDLTNVVTKTGDQTIDGVKTFIGQIVADCDIIQNGAAYETHAEQVFSVNDYIVTRDGQITGLSPGDLSGFHIKKYNGVDDSRLGVDNTGTMRVGDVGQEQPLMTRDETADMTSGNFVLWDGVNMKAITSSLAPSGVIQGSGDYGDDTHPVKIVNGEPVAVTDNLQKALSTGSGTIPAGVDRAGGTIDYKFFGSICIVRFVNVTLSASGYNKVIGTLPAEITPLRDYTNGVTKSDSTNTSLTTISSSGSILMNANNTGAFYGSITYFLD